MQVIATALAAVTSMLLSSYIGIAGSIIGVAVASVVSTLAASLYKRFLADSAEKIKELPVVSKTGEALSNVLPGLHDKADEQPADAAAEGAEGPSRGPTHPSEAAIATQPLAVSAAPSPDSPVTQPLGEATARPDGESTPTARLDEAPTTPSSSHAPGAPDEGADEAAALAALRHQRRLVRGLVAVCILSALLAVAASGAVVYLATMGAGLGEKPAPIYLSAPLSPVEDDASADSESAGAASSATSSASASSGASSSSSGSASSSSSSSASEGGEGEGGQEPPTPSIGGEDESGPSTLNPSVGSEPPASGEGQP